MALRAVIPDGGGVAAAAVMHHRVDMLTVEYRDWRGAIHGAVFFLPAHQIRRCRASPKWQYLFRPQCCRILSLEPRLLPGLIVKTPLPQEACLLLLQTGSTPMCQPNTESSFTSM
jgi:hypothetical protein